ncbi:hypothetical protein HO173_010707 [Letharia columbiana]|uniref:F-box domain-containing protein n=1 Tax=Letharia columbiana TaxID=112416 RepID=A0A8H6FM05_9LECA|nr:uncharacterized protein HO173_010707 [Letharia columbiana]KAF6231007.1 hypothetical protein HO173_010707 [Letharia columbiana]
MGSLPAEILEPILEEIHLNSISGVRALACASRTCRALASPYLFKPLKCEFIELVRGDDLGGLAVVTLSTADNFKTLKCQSGLRGQDRLRTFTQVLSVEHTYECFEYLPDRSLYHFNLSAPALDFLSRTLPLLSRLVIDLGDFIGYSPSWDQAYKKATKKNARYSHAPLSCVDGLNIVCAIARFQNLRHLTLHYRLQQDQIALMHPTPGCEAVRELFESIQRRKRGQAIVRLDVIFYTDSINVFGCVDRSWQIDPPTVSNTITIVCNNNTSSQGDKQSQCSCTCDNTDYGKVIERRKRTERLYGRQAWTYRLGSVQWKLLQGRYRTLPWSIVMQSLMWLALLPSNIVFEEGKRVRYEPSLADVEVSCRQDYSDRRTRFRERLFERILPY